MDKVGNVLINLVQDLSSISTNGHAHVEINRDLCGPREFENLFNYFTQGTILERIDLEVNTLSSKIKCGCGYQETVNGDDESKGYVRCPDCGKFAEIRDPAYKIVEPDPNLVGKRKSIRF